MANISFADRVVIVTGGGGALGRGFALDIARRGGAVVVNDLGGPVTGGDGTTQMADQIVDEIRAAGGKAVASYDSVATVEGASRIAATAMDNFGRIDALMNNAGNFRYAPFEELREEDLLALLSVHLVGSFNMTQAVWPQMKAQGYGRLVFTSSGAGMFGIHRLTAYGAAKAGIAGLMNSLSLEGAPHGILCNGLLPNAASRMTMTMTDGGQSTAGNSLREAIAPSMDPAYQTGIGVYLASEACDTTHSLYSSLGGRIARAFVGVTEGWYGSRDRPASADDIAAHIGDIRDTDRGFHIPAGLMEEHRIVATRLTS